MHTTPVAALERAVSLAGGQTALADALSQRRKVPISPARVWNWIRRDRKAPPEVCPDIEALFGIPCEELAPEVDWAVLRAGGNAANDESMAVSVGHGSAVLHSNASGV